MSSIHNNLTVDRVLGELEHLQRNLALIDRTTPTNVLRVRRGPESPTHVEFVTASDGRSIDELSDALKEARDEIDTLKREIEDLAYDENARLRKRDK